MNQSQRVLVVADWKADFGGVVEASRERNASSPTSFSLVVPARLHGLDWVGDPYSSVPCARRALAELGHMFRSSGLALNDARVGDPDPVAAITDIVLDERVDELLLCECRRHPQGGPFDLASRARRATGLPVTRVSLPDAAIRTRASAWRLVRDGHCETVAPRPA
jgi:hypothetical protein